MLTIDWDEDSVKEILPEVKCLFGGKIWNCRVAGRANKFATVYAVNNHALTAHFAWSTIAHCLNTKSILNGC